MADWAIREEVAIRGDAVETASVELTHAMARLKAHRVMS